MHIALTVSPSFTPLLSRSPSLTHVHSFILSLSLSPILCVLWCFIWYPTIKPLFELPSIVYGFFLWGETESCLKGLQSRRLPSYWCRGVLPSSLLDQSLTSLLFYGWGHFTERSLTTSPQRFAKRYSSDSWGGWKRQWRAAGSFPRQEEMNLDSATVTRTCPSTYLSSLTTLGAFGLSLGVVKSNRKSTERTTGCHQSLISVTLQMLHVCVSFCVFILNACSLWVVLNIVIFFARSSCSLVPINKFTSRHFKAFLSVVFLKARKFILAPNILSSHTSVFKDLWNQICHSSIQQL